MRRFAVVLVAIFLSVPPVAATNLITNGDFSAGLTDWTNSGVDTGASIYYAGAYGMPASPSGGDFAGTISGWNGSWSGPYASISQTFTFIGAGILSGELFAASRGPDSWRNAGVEVLFNNTVVSSLFRDGDTTKWAGDYPWTSFSLPVTGIGSNTLKVDFILHFGEYEWALVDNLQFNPTAAVPEPGILILLGLSMMSVAGLRRWWKE